MSAAVVFALAISLPARPLAPTALAQSVSAPPPVAARSDAPLRFGDPAEALLNLFPGARHDASVFDPARLLGQPIGTRLAHHQEILTSFEALAASSERMQLRFHGQSIEGRALMHGVFTSPANHARLDAWMASRFSDDPEGAPAVVWMGYSIHGDETSPADAALALAWHLAACTDDDVARLLDELVIVIDPVMNPDGRERILSQLEQSAGRVPNLDHASMQRGRWPFGRGNHYLFDMNRDWLAGVTPETRGRWGAIDAFEPQVLIDGHEMGALDTFLMYPQNEARHPQLPETLLGWQDRFADEQGAAFDARGWSYYTREWADGWYPGYSDAWGSLGGAIGLLYEQASTLGSPVRRESGEVVTYLESVEHTVASSLANLRTTLENRSEILRDFRASRSAALQPATPERVFCVPPDPVRVDRLAELESIFTGQNFRYKVVQEFELADAEHSMGASKTSVTMPAGTLVVQLAQERGRRVAAYLEFDPRLPDDYLIQERGDLERRGYGNMYDVTAWDLARALDLDAWWGETSLRGLRDLERAPFSAAPVDPAAPAWGFAVDGSSDRSLRFAAAAMELGLAVHLGDESFRAGGSEFPAWSLLLRAHENESVGDSFRTLVARAAAEARVEAVPLAGGRTPDEGPDLGGGYFVLLERPRVALLSNDPVSAEGFGSLWHHLDTRLGLPHSLIDAQALGSTDLRRFNVLILPPANDALAGLLERHGDDLRDWVRSGGTLIGIESGAVALLDADLGLSDVRLRRNALEDLPELRARARMQLNAGEEAIDFEALWSGQLAPGGAEFLEAADAEDSAGLEERDAWMRRFAPQGAILRAHVDTEHWLCAGLNDELPVFYGGSHAFVGDVPTPVRLAEQPGELRLSGLLWPEAAERLSLASAVTAESYGSGQVLLFAAHPVFRGYWLGTARTFSNAIVLGPGAGASPPRPR